MNKPILGPFDRKIQKLHMAKGLYLSQLALDAEAYISRSQHS